MMENIEQNLNNSANEIFANSYSNLNDDFFYDTKDDDFIDTDEVTDNKNSFSEKEVNKVGLSSSDDIINTLQTRVEDAINDQNIHSGDTNSISLNEPFNLSDNQIQPLPFDDDNIELAAQDSEKTEDLNEDKKNIENNGLEKEVKVSSLNDSSDEIINSDINEIENLKNTADEDEMELPSINIEQNSEENSTNKLDDSYVLSNFDVLFDSLYSDVTGANNFISNLIEQKRNVNVNEANLAESISKFEREKEEFNKYMDAQKQAIENEKKQCNEYIRTQKQRLQNEETQFNSDCESTRAELNLAEQTLKVANEKLNDEREQFEKNKNLEEEKLKSDRQKLDVEREQFEKEKAIALEKIKNGQKELQLQKEQFAKSKELEEKKLELESKNLSQSCARFKELVTQFNSGFQQLPDNKE